MSTPVSAQPGCIVLAAYQPDPTLFRIQLESIRDQTRTDWRCLVGADSGQDEVRRLVGEIVGDDPRFTVIGWDDNVGFYLNFERLMAAVPDDVGWVALSDQDDRWYPDKLARLVPLLDSYSLASGQSRLVTWPSNEVIAATTSRQVLPATSLLIQNQITGAQTVVRRQLLGIALPFPRLWTATQLHDHWLAMCAAVSGGYTVLDDVVQDYVQHSGNVVGERGRRHARTPWGIVREARHLAEMYAGGKQPGRVLSATRDAGLGWRRLVAVELLRRSPSAETARLGSAVGDSALASLRASIRAVRSPSVSASTALTLLAGVPGDVVVPSAPRGGVPLWGVEDVETGTPPLTFAVVLYRTAPADSPSLLSLASAVGQQSRDRVIVLDNSPPEDGRVPALPSQVDRYVPLPGNPGLAAAYEVAADDAETAGSRWVVLLDQDTHLTTEYVDELRSATARLGHAATRVDVIAPRLVAGTRRLSPHRRLRLLARPLEGPAVVADDWYAYNSGTALRISAVRQVGGFPPDFPLDYLDHAMGARLRGSGSALAILGAELTHELSMITPQDVPPTRLASILESERRFYASGHSRSDRHWLLIRRVLRLAALTVGVRRTPSFSTEVDALRRAVRVSTPSRGI